MLAVSAYEDSSTTGVNTDSGLANNDDDSAGAAYTFRFEDGNWTQTAYINKQKNGMVCYSIDNY